VTLPPSRIREPGDLSHPTEPCQPLMRAEQEDGERLLG
jgi:hypothetical protein